MLQGCAGGCKSPISKPVSILWFAECCTVLRSQWCQSGIKIAPPSACTDRGLKNREYGQSRRCHLRKRVNIEEQARVPQNPRIDPLSEGVSATLESIRRQIEEGSGKVETPPPPEGAEPHPETNPAVVDEDS
jgi:hypothetical protein